MAQRYQRGSFTTVPMGGLKGIRSTAQVLYLWMCHHSNQEGICWPSIGLLAEECGMHRVTVIRGIKYLEEQGLLAKTKRKSANRGWEANHYQVLIKDIHTPSSKCTTPLVAISDYPSSKEILELNPVELYKEELESKSFYLGKKSGAGLDALREVLRKDPRVRFILGEGTDSLE